jgi:DoxX-like family
MAIPDNAMTAAPDRGGAMQLWTGRVLSGLAVAFLAIDGAMKLVQPQVVIDSTAQLGWPTDGTTLFLLGSLLLIATALYAVPRTSVLGAILLTAYLGGAIATHARIGSPMFSHILFGVYIGLFVWGGLWLRDSRLRALLS